MELTTTLSNSTSLATLAAQTDREVLDTMTAEQLIDQSAVASRFGEMTLNKLRTWYRLLFARLENEDDIGKKYQFLEMGAVIFQDYLLTGDLFAAEYLEKVKELLIGIDLQQRHEVWGELEKKASSVKHARQSFNNWRYVETKWGVVAKGALEQVSNGIGTIADAAAMARAIEWPDACACINRAVIDRLQTTKRGRSAAKNVIAGDIKKAAATLKSGSAHINHPSSEEIRGLGLDLQDSGLLGPRRARAIQPNFFDDAEMDNATQQLRIGPEPGSTTKDKGYRGEPRTRKRRKVVSQDKPDPVLVYQCSDTSPSTRESPECRCTNQAIQFSSTIGCPSSTGSENVWALVVGVKDLIKDLCDIHVLKLAEYVELASDHISNIRTKLVCLASETSLATAKRRNRIWFTEFTNELDWLRIYPHLNYRPDITSHTQIRVSSERLFELIRPFVAFDESYGRMLREDGAVVIKNCLGRFQDQGQKWEKAYRSFGDEFSMFQHHGQGSELENPLVEAMKHSIVQQFFQQDLLGYLLQVFFRGDAELGLTALPTAAYLNQSGWIKNEVHVLNQDDYAKSKHSSLMTVLSFTKNEPDSLYTIGPVSLDLVRWKDSTAGYETHRELIIGHTEAETMPIFAGTAVKHANLHEGDWLFALPLTSVGRKTTGSGGVVKQLMPKYVAAQSLGNSEISGVGTIEEIQNHLRRKTAGDHTPNGKKEMHCGLQHPFPATIQLHPTSSVGAALVGMAQWSDPSTIHELKILFEEKNIRVAHKFLASTQSKMVDNVNDAYVRLHEMERSVFGKNSYFAQGSRQRHS